MDHNGFTKAGPVTHISLSSFITELWALMAAFSDAPGPCLIVTDCQNLCNQVTFLLKHNRIPRWWIHQSWWKWLKALLDTRKQLCAHPLQVQWSPADLADNLQDEQITDVFAHSHETTRTNIINNKVVDQLSRSMLQHKSTCQSLNPTSFRFMHIMYGWPSLLRISQHTNHQLHQQWRRHRVDYG